jgi:membrane protein EpsK
LTCFNWSMCKKLSSTGWWEVVSRVGVMLYMSIDLLLANRIFGAECGGRYAAVLQLPALLRSCCYAAGTIFAPTMYQIYGRKDIDGLVIYLNRSIKFLGLLLALPIGLMCGFSEPLLRIWLGPQFSGMSLLLSLMSIHLCVNLSVFPLYNLPLVANRVKTPGLATLGIGVGNLILALCLTGILSWGLYGLAAAGAIMLTIRNLVITPLYSAYIIRRPYRTFYRHILTVFLATTLTIAFCRLVLKCHPISAWTDLALAGIVVSLTFAAVIYLSISAEERSILRDGIIRWRKAA